MPKVLIADPIPDQMYRQVCSMMPAGVELCRVGDSSEESFRREASDAEVLIAVSRAIDERVLSLAPRVRFIQRPGVGYDNIDIAALKARGILAAYTPGANAAAVAEHTILLMLALIKRFPAATTAAKAGKWPMLEIAQAGIAELGTAVVGLVGFGSVGRAVAERLEGFGSRVFYTALHAAGRDVESQYNAAFVPLPDLLERSTIISLHVPLNEATKGMIGARELSLMPQGAYLVNTARGELVDEAALREAVTSGHLAGAGLDLVRNEREGGNPFADLENVIVTPHIAGVSRASIMRMTQMSVANIVRFFNRQPVNDIIPELDTPPAASA